MLNISNILSLSRAGFALAFLQDNALIRLFAILLAMASDFLDGYIARRQQTVSQFGAFLDPIMDKFFVFFSGGIFFLEGRISTLELGAFLSRDISLCLFGLYLGIIKGWNGYECKAIWWGKITTLVQFITLIGLTLGVIYPSYIYSIFVAMAAFAFIELLTRFRRSPSK